MTARKTLAFPDLRSTGKITDITILRIAKMIKSVSKIRRRLSGDFQAYGWFGVRTKGAPGECPPRAWPDRADRGGWISAGSGKRATVPRSLLRILQTVGGSVQRGAGVVPPRFVRGCRALPGAKTRRGGSAEGRFRRPLQESAAPYIPAGRAVWLTARSLSRGIRAGCSGPFADRSRSNGSAGPAVLGEAALS